MSDKLVQLHVKDKDNAAALRCAVGDYVTMVFETEYLPGVVVAEMGYGPLEAQKAQAVAARSLAYVNAILGNGAISDIGGEGQAFDAVKRDSAAYAQCHQAVADTVGIVVTCGGKPVKTHYTASNGGMTVSAKDKWGGDLPYEIAQVDPWDEMARSGHGVGMSQEGAMYAADQGKTYREILAFYYPDTVLMGDYGEEELTVQDEDKFQTIVENAETTSEAEETTKTIFKKTKMQVVIGFVRDQLGEPYDLGDHGPDRWDCSGLTMEAVELIGLYWSHSSHWQWENGIKLSGDFDAYGTLDTLPSGRSAFLFHYGQRTNGEMGMVHVGVLDGETGSVIQAGGYCGTGVHENPYSKCKPHFSHWATLKVADEPTDVIAETQSDIPATLRIGNEGELVKTLQNLLNAYGAGLVVDGKFGPLTEGAVFDYQSKYGLKVDGIVGPQTWGALLNKTQKVLFTATITDLSVENKTKVAEEWPNATFQQQ